MSDDGSIRWLVEEREMWKRRAEVAEAELVHRDRVNEKALVNETRSDRLDIPRDKLQMVNVIVDYDQLQYGGKDAMERFLRSIGNELMVRNCLQAIQQPDSLAVAIRSWSIEAPSETRLNYDNVGRFFRLRG